MSQTPSSSAELLRGEGLPNFGAITPDLVRSAIPLLLAELEQRLEDIENDLLQAGPITWERLMPPLQQIGERLRWSWGVVGHLLGVCNTERSA